MESENILWLTVSTFDIDCCIFSCVFRLGSTPELTGTVVTPAFMGAPVILIEKLFSGQESLSAVKAAVAVLCAGDAVNEHDNGEGIKEVKGVQEWMSANNEV